MDGMKERSAVIRRANMADAEALAAILHEAAAAMCGGIPPTADSAFEDLRDPRIDTLVAEGADGVQGFLQLRRDGSPPSAGWMQGSVELRHHHVRMRHRGAGVAPRLLDAALELARARHAACIWLKVDKAAPQANGFYRKHGFLIAGTALFAVGGVQREHWVMRRMLAK